VRVPKEAADGRARVRLTFEDWPEGKVASWEGEVEVRTGLPPSGPRLEPGDVVACFIPGLHTPYVAFEVDADGQIFFPGAGNVLAAGMTYWAIRKSLQSLVGQAVKDAEMRIDVVFAPPAHGRTRPQERVDILGAAPQPVTLFYHAGLRLDQALGAVNIALGSRREDLLERRIDIRHLDGTGLSIDPRKNRSAWNILLRPGDRVSLLFESPH
jgi:protein involved in polysaccharide export with SLBB domain